MWWSGCWSSRRLGGREEEGLVTQSWWWWRVSGRVPSSPGLVTCQSRDAGGQDRWQQPHGVSGCGPNVCFLNSPWMGRLDLRRNFPQSPSWMVVVVVVVVRGAGGVFSLLTSEEQAAEHLGSCQESPRPWPRPLGDGGRRENSWTPGQLWPVPMWGPLLVWQRRPPRVAMWSGEWGGLWPPWKC